ncbi:hypothetical protein LOTGIDRAFT_233205 [Lottia gigantea]|uniref:Glutathione transferase n=1 Tax=Lottia gigantea TaxID=225164 RepID=V4BSU1_LOTGI|nr:hypothetical protein LOTGIDRAFT_233205 [Lottia gigantea]ESO92139.1 hypothetical protein LOTGIDRAFT_233205 [Lottia gigantea]
MSGAKLIYFNGRGRAEIIRLVLGYLEIEYEEEYLTEKSQIEKLRADGKLLFQQVPVLEIDGRIWCQGGAIVRYLARKGRIYGNNDLDASRIDELYDGSRDFWIAFAAIGFQDEAQALQTSLISKTMPRYLPIFNKILEDNGSGYLYGKSVTLADLGLLEALLMVHEYFGTSSMEAFPAVQKFYNLMTEDSKIAAFLKSPHRKGKNDDVYVSTVMKVLT